MKLSRRLKRPNYLKLINCDIMKSITITKENSQLYDMLFQAIIGAPVKGSADVDSAYEVMKVFKSQGMLSSVAVEAELGFYVYNDLAESVTLEFEDAHFKWMKEKFAETQWRNAVKIDEIKALKDLLDNPQTKKKE